MSKLRSIATMVIVSMACWGQKKAPLTTYNRLYLDRLGKTVDTNRAGGYLFEEIYDQPRTQGQPYYPILKVTKNGNVVRTITPDDIPLDDSDCLDGTCSEIRSKNPTFEFRWGPCFGKAIFDGPTFLAYAPKGNVFYFYVITQSPALWNDRTFIIYYADLESNQLFKIGQSWGESIETGTVSSEENYIAYRAVFDLDGVVGLPLEVMDISNRSEMSFPKALGLPTDIFKFYSIHSYKWLDGNRIQMEIYAYKDNPGPEETLTGATIQTITYDMPVPPALQSKGATSQSYKRSSTSAGSFIQPITIKKPKKSKARNTSKVSKTNSLTEKISTTTAQSH